MNELTKEELLEIKGGGAGTLTATFIAAMVRGINSIIDVGRSLGTAVRRTSEGNICPL